MASAIVNVRYMVDDVDAAVAWYTKHLGFTLLSDPDRAVAAQLGAKRGPSFLPNKRITFVIDTDRKILGVFHSEVSMGSHAAKALALLKGRTAA